MEIIKTASAGTLESSDILITVEKGANGLELDFSSSVENQFGEQIRKVIMETLSSAGVKSAKIRANDRGALDCTVKARVLTALHRAAQSEEYNWEA